MKRAGSSLVLIVAVLLTSSARAQNVILMSAAQCAQVTGPANPPTEPPRELRPVPLTDGRCIVGPEVISDPAFADRKALLQSFPQVDYSTLASLVPQ